MNCRVNIAAVASGDIGISYCQEISTAGRKHRHSVSVNTGWGLKQIKQQIFLHIINVNKVSKQGGSKQ